MRARGELHLLCYLPKSDCNLPQAAPNAIKLKYSRAEERRREQSLKYKKNTKYLGTERVCNHGILQSSDIEVENCESKRLKTCNDSHQLSSFLFNKYAYVGMTVDQCHVNIGRQPSVVLGRTG